MTKRITVPIKEQLNKAGKQMEDTLRDYSSRMFARLQRVETQFEEIERSTEKAIQNSQDAKKKVSEAAIIIERELQTRENVMRAMSELAAILNDGGEELSDLSGKLSLAHTEIDATSQLANQIGALARGGRWDITNVAMLAKTVELFSQSDPETIGALMDKIDLEKWQQALIARNPKRWLEIEMAFENARQGRK